MFVDRLLTVADLNAQKLAVADSTRQLTYAHLVRFAQVMRDLIIKECRGQQVGILLPGCAAFVGTLYGCMWAQRVAVPLNFLLQPSELARIVRDAQLDAVISITHFQSVVDALDVRPVYLDQLGLKRKFLFATFKRAPEVPQVAPDQTAVILYTSGTSSEPKGVELTYLNLASNCRDSIAHAGIKPVHTLLSVLPPFHIFGLTAMTLLPMWTGITVHYIPRFSPVKAVKTIEQERISIFMAIPSMYAAMQRVKHATADSYRSLFLAISGGEPLQASTARAFREQFGLEIYEGYGLTETSPVVSINLPGDCEAGSVGRPIPNCEVRIVDPTGKVLPPGEKGEIQIRGPGVMKGYFGLPDQTAAVMECGGWFRTGDQGSLSQRGYLSITGRIKEMLIIGGENVFPGEIEKVLVTHPAVSEAAVIGTPDSSRGEVPVAYVIPEESAEVTEGELRSLCREHLAGFKVPRRVYLRADLPRGPTGKILKRCLNADGSVPPDASS